MLAWHGGALLVHDVRHIMVVITMGLQRGGGRTCCIAGTVPPPPSREPITKMLASNYAGHVSEL